MNQTGTVKWFSGSKGIGFITPDNGGSELFAHFSEIVCARGFKTLSGAQRVRFDVKHGRRCGRATNIRNA